ncbi:MAG: CIA30 family protein [Candidatus Omnitrophica bacterium]|nr:CIA30 family protein [Candidatus Omnitrophota bacterium]MDD5436369.1 CIA30 family protein [Candidatus Omnitrophota bacterium]
MYKKILIIALLLFCLSTSLIIFAKYLLSKKEIALDQTNRTFLVRGDVKIKSSAEGSPWRQMDTSTVLEKGDIVKTSGGSKADIVIGVNTDKAVKIEENSSVEFQSINPASLNCPGGKLLVAIKKLEPKSSFVVKTPTAICGARGTGWSQEAAPAKTSICVFESSVFVQGVGAGGKPKKETYTVNEGTERVLAKDRPISEPLKIGEEDLRDWRSWSKNVEFLRDGKILVNDFERNENFNNLDGVCGSWNVFYSDDTQYCKDEITDAERMNGEGCSLKLTYDVDTKFSSYNGFFTKLMDIDVSDYKYLVFYVKGDEKAGYTTRINVELKNRNQTGRATVDDINGEWKKVVIPLNKFVGMSNFKNMREFVVVFSDINVSRKEGVIYIDDIYFAKDEVLL